MNTKDSSLMSSEDITTPNKRKRKTTFVDEDDNEDNSSIDSKELTNSVVMDDKSSIKSEDLSLTLISNDKNNEKLFRKILIKKKRPAVSFYSKDKLLRVCCNAFSEHRMITGAKLMPTLAKDQRIPHSFIINAAFILFSQYSSDLLVKSMKTLSKYDVNKREIILKVIMNFIKNKDSIGAKKYIESNKSYLKMNGYYRTNKVIDTYLKCYTYYIDYKEWKQSVEESNDNIFYHSNRVIAEKTKLSLKNIITETKDLNLDYFVLILIEMYEYSQQFSDANEILKIYVENNPQHLNAYIYLYNFGLKYPDYTNNESQINALKHISKYSPDNPLVLNLVESDGITSNSFIKLMDFIDHKNNFNDINGWIQLKHFITSINDLQLKHQIKNIWENHYKTYWIRLHFNVNKIKELNEIVIQLIRCKQKVIEFFCSSSHSFIRETNDKIDGYQTLFNL